MYAYAMREVVLWRMGVQSRLQLLDVHIVAIRG